MADIRINKEELLESLLKNPRIAKRVNELNLNRDQMIEAIPVMIDMQSEEDEISELDKLTSFYVSEHGSVLRTYVLSPKGKEKKYIDNIITNKIFPLDFEDRKPFDQEEGRRKIVEDFSNLLKNPGTAEKGFFIYGDMGIGKTFMLKRFLKKLAEHDKNVAFANVSELMSKIKNTFNSDSNQEELLDTLKTVDYLFLDDIGAENIAAWFRDGYLFEILNERMDKHRITFFTSNYSIDKLKEVQSRTQNQKFKDYDKAQRLIERIKAMSKEYFIKGKNKRY